VVDVFLELGNFDFTFSFNNETVEEKVDVLAIEAVSMSLTALAGLAGFIFGEAGWKRVGGLSLGKRLCGKAGKPAGILNDVMSPFKCCVYESLRTEVFIKVD